MKENDDICRITIIGAGMMGSGLASILSQHHEISLYGKNTTRTSLLAEKLGVKTSNELAELLKNADVILLAVKPKDLSSVANELSGKIRDDQILVSILGGVNYEMLKIHFKNTLILRMMPNMPSFYGEGVVAFADRGLFSNEEKKEFDDIFWPLGKIHWIPENKIDAITALAASGPAFAFLIIESMVDAGIALGLSSELAKDIATQMFLGAMTTLRRTGKHPGELKWSVTSPGGCTIAGIKTFEDEAIRSGIINTFITTYESLREFSDQ